MKINKVLILLCALSTTVSNLAQKKEKISGNKEVTELIKEIPQDFNALEVNDDLEIAISQGSGNGFRLYADSNLHTVVQFIVTDSILKIFTTENITSSKKLEINLTVKGLEHLMVKHNSKVIGEGQLSADKFYISGYDGARIDLDVAADDVNATLHRNAGGKLKIDSENATLAMNDRTDLKATVRAEKVRVTLNNTADLDLSGDAEYAAFNLKKSANLNARKMRVSSVDLYTSNNADVYVNASRNLEVYAQGKSNVYVYGNPQIEVKGLTDKSKIIKK